MSETKIYFETNERKNDISNNAAAVAIQLIKSKYELELAKVSTVPISEKKLLSVEEAAELFGVGRGKIRELTNSEDCKYVIWIGAHRRIKRDEFEKYLMSQYSI